MKITAYSSRTASGGGEDLAGPRGAARALVGPSAAFARLKHGGLTAEGKEERSPRTRPRPPEAIGPVGDAAGGHDGPRGAGAPVFRRLPGICESIVLSRGTRGDGNSQYL